MGVIEKGGFENLVSLANLNLDTIASARCRFLQNWESEIVLVV